MKSSIVKRSIAVGRRRTAVSLEPAFWDALNEIADKHAMTPSQLVTTIDMNREHQPLICDQTFCSWRLSRRGIGSGPSPGRAGSVARSENG